MFFRTEGIVQTFHLCSYLNANSATDPNSSVGDKGAQILIADIKDTRSMLSGLGVTLEVGTSDAGAYFNNKVLAEVDYGVRPPLSSYCSALSLKTLHVFSWQMYTLGLQMSLCNNPRRGPQPFSAR